MNKKILCPDCEGRGVFIHDSDNFTEPCNRCWYTGYIEVPMTNADQIREMDDEDLADILLNWFSNGADDAYVSDFNVVYDQILAWLKEEVQE